jgi:chromosome segregation and condensation protein ScpB
MAGSKKKPRKVAKNIIHITRVKKAKENGQRNSNPKKLQVTPQFKKQVGLRQTTNQPTTKDMFQMELVSLTL